MWPINGIFDCGNQFLLDTVYYQCTHYVVVGRAEVGGSGEGPYAVCTRTPINIPIVTIGTRVKI